MADVSMRTVQGLLENGVHPSQLDQTPPPQPAPTYSDPALHERIRQHQLELLRQQQLEEEERQRRLMVKPLSLWEIFLQGLRLQNKQ